MRITIIAFIVLSNLACKRVSLSSNEPVSVLHRSNGPVYKNIYLTEAYKGEGRLTSKKEELPKYLFTTKLSSRLKHTTLALLKKEIEEQSHCIINGCVNPELDAKRLNIVGDSLPLIEVFRKIHNELPELDFYFAGPYVGLRGMQP